MTDNRAAWADFWSSESAAPTCLPRGLQEINDAQTALWHDFARILPHQAHVLDLGTGDGAVLKKMQALRTDLKLTGVDSSPTLPRSPAGISLLAGVPFESLPFRDATFDAATSQFGYEYGDTKAAAGELARVLRERARLVCAVHKSDGPILAHNLGRRTALRWALDSGWLDKAREVARARATEPVATPADFSAAAERAAGEFPQQPVANEFLLALVQTLELGRDRPPAETLEVLGRLETKARNEIARIDTLERAACDEQRLAAIVSQLADAGFEMGEPDELLERSTRRGFAWIVWGKRRSS